MKYVFGPVPSRRLGQSLGIDTIPLKTCNWNCVYCQLGRSLPMTNERREYFPREAILAEVKEALAAHRPGEIDWVTFVGSGEPTLHSGLGWLIRQVKASTELPVAVITNGALLYRPEVRQELYPADAVIPTLTAGSAHLHRDIHRPMYELSYERMIEGLVAFRQEYAGRLWIGFMLIQGLNDSEEALRELAAVLQRIRPDEVHITLPTRPPAETWVQPPDEAGVQRALTILGGVARLFPPAGGHFDLSQCESPVDAILAIITRHPMRQEELERSLGRWQPGRIQAVLAELAASGQAQTVERNGVLYWSAIPAYYPDEPHSRVVSPEQRRQRQGRP